MIHAAKTVRTLQAVAMTVGLALFLWSTGLPTLFQSAAAASITNASDTLSTAAPGVVANHTFQFGLPMGALVGAQITLTFPTGAGEFAFPSTAGFGFDDIDVNVNGSSTALGLSPSGVQWGVATTSSAITFTTSGSVVASSAVLVIRIGTNATSSGNATGTEQITNPTATTTSYGIDIGGTIADSGQVRVAIIDQVTVSADINTSLQFTVSGVNAGATINGSPTSTSATSSHVSLPFGTLGINQSKVLAQRLNVSTNATNGYSVTVQQDTEFMSTIGAVIDGFADGSWTGTPAPWQGPSANVANAATYGHWGLTSTDGTTTRTLEFGSDQWVSGSTTAPIVIMGHDDVSDGTTDGIGSTTVGYQVQISALQEAGDDYSTRLRYVATPVF